VSLFGNDWDEDRIARIERHMRWVEDDITKLTVTQNIDGGNVERMSQRLTSYERNAHLYNTLTQALKPKANILDTKGEPLVSPCSKDRIFELRLQALEQGKPVALADVVKEALEELQINGTKLERDYNGCAYQAVDSGLENAIALLEYATSLTKGEEV
jgi:hypothetical protein